MHSWVYSGYELLGLCCEALTRLEEQQPEEEEERADEEEEEGEGEEAASNSNGVGGRSGAEEEGNAASEEAQRGRAGRRRRPKQRRGLGGARRLARAGTAGDGDGGGRRRGPLSSSSSSSSGGSSRRVGGSEQLALLESVAARLELLGAVSPGSYQHAALSARYLGRAEQVGLIGWLSGALLKTAPWFGGGERVFFCVCVCVCVCACMVERKISVRLTSLILLFHPCALPSLQRGAGPGEAGRRHAARARGLR